MQGSRSDFVDFVGAGVLPLPDSSAVAEASACLDRFTAAFNACSLEGMDRELQFPHIMFSGAERLVWERAGQHPADLFARLRAAGWAFTQYESKEPVLVCADKVHFLVTYVRRDREGRVLSTHRNLWLVTRVAGRWGIALRSY